MKGGRAERVLVATREWRTAALAAIAAGGRGTHARCAEAAGCSPGTLTQLLDGDIGSSEFVGPVSDFLGIPRRRQVAYEPELAEAHERLERLTPEQRTVVIGLLRHLTPDDTE